jgi:hypothetical protein
MIVNPSYHCSGGHRFRHLPGATSYRGWDYSGFSQSCLNAGVTLQNMSDRYFPRFHIIVNHDII